MMRSPPPERRCEACLRAPVRSTDASLGEEILDRPQSFRHLRPPRQKAHPLAQGLPSQNRPDTAGEFPQVPHKTEPGRDGSLSGGEYHVPDDPVEFAGSIPEVLGAGDGVLPHGRPEAVTPQDPRKVGGGTAPVRLAIRTASGLIPDRAGGARCGGPARGIGIAPGGGLLAGRQEVGLGVPTAERIRSRTPMEQPSPFARRRTGAETADSLPI